MEPGDSEAGGCGFRVRAAAAGDQSESVQDFKLGSLGLAGSGRPPGGARGRGHESRAGRGKAAERGTVTIMSE